jgi:DNA-binding LacI/PurR family transcriptional regulator
VRIDPSAATPLYQQVATDLRRKIVDGVLAVGEQLPPHRELAKQYGVSVITINKALSGLVSEGVLHSRVGRGTHVAVRPAAMATTAPWRDQGVARPTQRTLGFVLRDLNSPYFSLVAHAAEAHAHAAGCGMLLLSSGNVSEREDSQIRRLIDIGVDGLIVVSMNRTYRLSESLQELHRKQFPFVMVSYTAGDDVPFVGLDFVRAGELVAEHFLRLGRRRWGYIADRFGSLASESRSSGYTRLARQAGIRVDDAFVFEYPYEGEWNDYHSGYDLGEHIAGLSERPDALFVHNDLGALGLIDGLRDHGVSVPDDIAIVGLDDIAVAARSRVPLTTVRQPTDRIGALAVDAVLAQLRGERTPIRRLIAPELIIRQSCGATAAMRTPEVAPLQPSRERVRRPRSLAEHGRIERARLELAGVTGEPP